MAQWLTNPTGIQPLASLSGLRIQCRCELWCSLQTQLGSHIAMAVAQAGSYSSDSTPSLGTSIRHGYGPKKTKDQKKKKKKDVVKIYTMENYSAIKKDRIMLFTAT